MYHVLTILLHRPFVADGHLYMTSRSVSVNSLITCASAATSIVALLRAYDKVFSIKRAPYLISYATYVAATIHVRIAAKSSPGSDAYHCLQACLDIFEENQETNTAVKRAKLIVRNLMQRLGVAGFKSDVGLRHRVDMGLDGYNPHTSEETNASTGANAESLGLLRESTEGPDHTSTATPKTNWSDIDGIIQSFVGGQAADLDAAEEHPPFNEVVAIPNHGPNTPGRLWVDGDILRCPEDQRPVEDSDRPFAGGYVGDNGSMSIEDLLFGFNGSALDSLMM